MGHRLMIALASANVVDASVPNDATRAPVNLPVDRRAAMVGAVGPVMRRAAMMRRNRAAVKLGELGLGLVQAGLGRGVDLFAGWRSRGGFGLPGGSLGDRHAAEARSGQAAEKAHHK